MDLHSEESDVRSARCDDNSTDPSIETSSNSDCEVLSIDSFQGEEKWRDVWGPIQHLSALIRAGCNDPRVLLVQVFGLDEKSLPSDSDELLNLLVRLLTEPPPRQRIKSINSLETVLELLSNAKSILVITGAGISVSCGIPDFRSRDGIYARLARDYPDLSSPQAMFDMNYFMNNPYPFFKFAKEIFPGQFTPSLTHRLIALLEYKGKLLRNYTQNIDTLEQTAGITRLVQCHGSFSSATCTTCKFTVPGSFIKDAIFAKDIPHCPICWPESDVASRSLVHLDDGKGPPDSDYKTQKGDRVACKDDPAYGVLKPDIVFFGEGLSNEFHDTLSQDVKQTDLVLVIGSSLKVRPVSHIPNAIPGHIPQILINREPLSNHNFDVELLGNCDTIVSELCLRLGWELSGLSHCKMLTEVPLNVLLKKSTGGMSPTDVNHVNDSTAVPPQLDGTNISKQLICASSSSASVAHLPGRTELDETVPVQSLNDVIDKEDPDDNDSFCEVAALLPPKSFIRIPPNRYAFLGAEFSLNRSFDGKSSESSPSSAVCSPMYEENAESYPDIGVSSSFDKTLPQCELEPSSTTFDRVAAKRSNSESKSEIPNSPKQLRSV